MSKVKVTQIKSKHGRKLSHQLCLKGLGLRRIGHSVIVNETPSITGMLTKVWYMITVSRV